MKSTDCDVLTDIETAALLCFKLIDPSYSSCLCNTVQVVGSLLVAFKLEINQVVSVV